MLERLLLTVKLIAFCQLNLQCENVRLGDSISCSGVCLTIMRVKKKLLNLIFHLKQKKTNLTNFRVGDQINLEKIIKSWR